MKYACLTRFYSDGKVTAKVVRVPSDDHNRTHNLSFCEEVVTVFKTREEAQYQADQETQDNEETETQQWNSLTNNL